MRRESPDYDQALEENLDNAIADAEREMELDADEYGLDDTGCK